MYLLDTVVLSEMRKRNPDVSVTDWLNDRPVATLFISVVTVGEIERGIERQRTQNPAFAKALEQWLEQLIAFYSDRILPVDVPAAKRWGQLSDLIGHSGTDLLIAATGLEYGLTVVTRNTRHFLPTGVIVENPFDTPP